MVNVKGGGGRGVDFTVMLHGLALCANVSIKRCPLCVYVSLHVQAHVCA